MLVRNCAGGVIFNGEKVFLLKNENEEWVLPKVVVKNGELPDIVALEKVQEETGILANIVESIGNTSYEFCSVSREKPICNKILWYIMKAETQNYSINKGLNFIDGGFYEINDAINLITFNQDKSLLNLSYKKYQECDSNCVLSYARSN